MKRTSGPSRAQLPSLKQPFHTNSPGVFHWESQHLSQGTSDMFQSAFIGLEVLAKYMVTCALNPSTDELQCKRNPSLAFILVRRTKA